MTEPLVVRLEFIGEAAETIQQFSMITKRSPEGVVADALTIYYWILSEQTAGKHIVSLTEDLKDRTPMPILSLTRSRPNPL